MTAERPRAVPPALPEPRIVVPDEITLCYMPAHLSNYSRVVRTPSLIVLHATQGCEGKTKDADVAAMFSRPFPPGQKKRSAHYAVDADSATRSVSDEMTAWHCGHHGNARGIGIELCGMANQTRAEWFDELSLATMQVAARLVADLCARWRIPAVVVNERALVAGESGITTHAFVSAAWHETNHYDPGAGFPLGSFVAAVAAATVALGPQRDGP